MGLQSCAGTSYTHGYQFTDVLHTNQERVYAKINVRLMLSHMYPKIHPRKLQRPIRTDISKAVTVLQNKRHSLCPLCRTIAGQV